MRRIGRFLIPNAGTLIIVSLLFLVHVVEGRPRAEAVQPLATSQTLVSYQGTLTDPTGTPIDETVSMEFALYNAASGGTRKWGPETQNVTVSNGLFHALLGSATPIDPATLTGDLYLSIKVGGEEMLPRERLTSVLDAARSSALVADARAQGDFNLGGHTLNYVGNIYGVDGNAQIHMPGAPNSGNIYLNWHSGKKLIFGGGTGTEKFVVDEYGNGRFAGDGQFLDMDITLGGTDQGHVVLRQDGTRSLYLLPWAGAGYAFDEVCVGCATSANLTVHGNVSCGALTEANLQTEEERSAEHIDRFEEGDVLCWGDGRLEKCTQVGDPLIQAVADASGRPIVIGAELVKILGPVKRGDFLVASLLPGYAMAANSPAFGTVIAQALEDFPGERGIIKAMIRKM